MRLLERVGWLESKRVTRFWEGGFLGVLGSKKISESRGRQRMVGGFEEKR